MSLIFMRRPLLSTPSRTPYIRCSVSDTASNSSSPTRGDLQANSIESIRHRGEATRRQKQHSTQAGKGEGDEEHSRKAESTTQDTSRQPKAGIREIDQEAQHRELCEKMDKLMEHAAFQKLAMAVFLGGYLGHLAALALPF
jgi:hypothetical protein